MLVYTAMREMKNTPRSAVHIGFDGRVHKRFSGKHAQERFDNEVRMLEYLETERPSQKEIIKALSSNEQMDFNDKDFEAFAKQGFKRL